MPVILTLRRGSVQITKLQLLELVRNLVAHGDAREGKWRRNWRMECVTSTLTPPPNVVYPALLKLMRTPRLPAVDWTDNPTDLNGLVRFGERRNLVSARVPSRSARAILIFTKGWAVVRSEGNMSLKNPVTPPGIDPGTVRLVAQRLNHYATPSPRCNDDIDT